MPAPTTITALGRTVELVCHMGVFSGRFRRNSFAAIRECFEHGAGRIEIDIHSLDGPDYAVFHDGRLEQATDRRGSVGRSTPDDLRASRFLDHPEDRPPLLSEVVDMARGCSTEMQLDLKDWRPLTDARLRALAGVVEPVHERVIVSSPQDWNLRRLHAFAPELAIGFDPGHYLDHAIEGTPIFLPRTMGSYGYRDDHPLAFGRTAPAAGYLRERMEMIVLQAPGSREFFLNFRLVLQMLDDGFDVAAWLHERAIDANVWTADFRGPDTVREVERLVAAGIDRITTNTAPAWVEAFAGRALA